MAAFPEESGQHIQITQCGYWDLSGIYKRAVCSHILGLNFFTAAQPQHKACETTGPLNKNFLDQPRSHPSHFVYHYILEDIWSDLALRGTKTIIL